jgi:DNA polymerase III gamma/tau subunit
LISSSHSAVEGGEDEARAMLGTMARDHVERLVELLASMNVPELMKCARSLEEFAPDYAQVLDELAGLLVRVAMKQSVADFEAMICTRPSCWSGRRSALARRRSAVLSDGDHRDGAIWRWRPIRARGLR